MYTNPYMMYDMDLLQKGIKLAVQGERGLPSTMYRDLLFNIITDKIKHKFFK